MLSPGRTHGLWLGAQQALKEVEDTGSLAAHNHLHFHSLQTPSLVKGPCSNHKGLGVTGQD